MSAAAPTTTISPWSPISTISPRSAATWRGRPTRPMSARTRVAWTGSQRSSTTYRAGALGTRGVPASARPSAAGHQRLEDGHRALAVPVGIAAQAGHLAALRIEDHRNGKPENRHRPGQLLPRIAVLGQVLHPDLVE